MPGGMGGLGGGIGGAIGQVSNIVRDVYDVDRWKRSDELDAGTGGMGAPMQPGMQQPDQLTMVQAVRDAWDKKEGRNKKSPVQAAKNLFSGKRSKKEKDRQDGWKTYEEKHPPDTAGTVLAPEMKKKLRGSQTDSQILPLPDQQAFSAKEDAKERGLLGLYTRADIDDFFSANPVNSVWLAVDTLSLGGLALNQIGRLHAGPTPGLEEEVTRAKALQKENGGSSESSDKREDAKTFKSNMIADRIGTDYMRSVKEDREERKYSVHIT